MNENKKLSAPLKKMQDEVLRLRSELSEYDEEKKEMRQTKAKLLVVESGQSGISWEYETLLQRLSDLKIERDELRTNLRASVFDVKQKSAFRGLLLEKKLGAMSRLQEEREAQLNEVLSRANLEPRFVCNLTILAFLVIESGLDWIQYLFFAYSFCYLSLYFDRF
jgi:hypothetical protein